MNNFFRLLKVIIVLFLCASATSAQQFSGGGGGATTGIGYVTNQYFDTNGNGTYKPDPNLVSVFVECAAQGGGGGGAAASSTGVSSGGGGGAGSYASAMLSKSQIGASQAITNTAAANGGATGNNAGTAGNDTSLGSLLVCKGGSGGGGAAANSDGTPGAGGIAGTGDRTIPGNAGGRGEGAAITTVSTAAGLGAGGPWGGAPAGVQGSASAVAGNAGTGCGAGGGGGQSAGSASTAAGGAGAAGCMRFTEYNSGSIAVTLDAVGSADLLVNNTTSLSYTNLTVGTGSNRALVAVLAFGSASNTFPTAITCTWDGVSMTQITGTLGQAQEVTPREVSTVMFGLVAPHSGNKTLACSWTSNQYCYVSAISFTGASQVGGTTTFANGTANTGNSTNANVSVTSTANGYVVGSLSDYNAITSVNQTQLYLDNSGAQQNGAANYGIGTGGALTLSAVSALEIWSYSAVAIAHP